MNANKNPLGLPTEVIELPSKGLIYPEDHILHSGKLEIVYPGAKQEDILTNANYIDKGLAYTIDKYLESIVLTDVNLDELIPGDKDGLMIAARILGLGKNYTTNITIDKKPEPITFDLTYLQEKTLKEDLITPGVNEFTYTLQRGQVIKFKLLTGVDVTKMEEEEAGIKKTSPGYSASTSLYLKFAITEVDGERKVGEIRKFVDRMLQTDTRELKKYISEVTPGYVWKANGVRANNEVVEDLYVPFTADFFWPIS
jgi:hypothetical protein